ncbi:MAG: PAS domain S-box protein, partial [Candidatus Thorarchaeota archaeon]
MRDADAIIGDRYRSILEMANDGIIVIQDDKIAMVNHAFCKMLGVDSSKIVGKSFESILDPVAMHLYHENQERFIWGQTSRPSFRVRLIASKRKTIIVEMSTADFIYEGQPAVVVITRNIMEKMALETAIETSEARYRNLFASSPFAYFTLSQRGTIQQVNNAACNLLAYEESDLLKRNISTFLVKDETGQDAGTQILSEINQGKSITDLELLMRRSDSDEIWVSITASLLETQSQSSEIGFTVVDIDRRKDAETRERVERGRADLYLEVMTHDMNNVNQSLMFSLELINETMDLPKRIQNMLRDTNWSIRRSARMIATMRTIINLRENPPERIKIDISENLSKAVEMVKQDFPWKQLNIRIDVKNGNLYLAGHSYLENVFFHLLHNAVTYDERETVDVEVVVRREPSTRTIRIEIIDQGPGVPDGIKDMIFRRT